MAVHISSPVFSFCQRTINPAGKLAMYGYSADTHDGASVIRSAIVSNCCSDFQGPLKTEGTRPDPICELYRSYCDTVITQRQKALTGGQRE